MTLHRKLFEHTLKTLVWW